MTEEHPPVPTRTPDDLLDGRDRSDAIEVSYRPAGRAPRKLVFVPRATYGPGWERVELVRGDSGEWRPVGSELVDDVAVEVGADDA